MKADEYRIRAEVDLDAIRSNFRTLAAKKPNCKVYAVLKADGYGHGAVRIAKLLASEAYGFAVATAAEAIELRDRGILNEILILSPAPDEDVELLIRREIRLTVFEVQSAKVLSEAALRVKKPAYVHIKVDSGMGRIGLTPNEAGLKILEEIVSLPGIKAEGIFTHFATMDMPDESHALAQAVRFRGFVNRAEKAGITFETVHLSNSAAVLRNKLFRAENAIRLGIALYGIYPSADVRYPDALKPALSLKSRISYVHEIPAGTPISYGETFVARRKMRVAVVSAGYADGIPRSMSNRGEVLVHGQRSRILGRICMDQFMIDVSRIPEAAVGDEVVIVGRQGEDEITLLEIDEWSGRFPYEFLTLVGHRVPRTYLEGRY